MNDPQMNLDLKEPVKFYWFDQNNSGGYWVKDENFGENVLIEARSTGEANEILFHKLGALYHGSCECCGERWSHLWEEYDDYRTFPTADAAKAKAAPQPDAERSWSRKGDELVIHYLDGRVEWFNRRAPGETPW